MERGAGKAHGARERLTLVALLTLGLAWSLWAGYAALKLRAQKALPRASNDIRNIYSR